MRIFIVGLGTIGEPLAHLFLRVRDALDIEEIIIHKNTPELRYRGMLKRFHMHEAKLAVYAEKRDEFAHLLQPAGFGPEYTFDEALDRADVVIDCTKEKIGRKLKEKYYQHFAGSKKRFIAQGSEKGFGKPYAFDINDEAIGPDDEFIQVVSCNTHQILCILKTLVARHGGYDQIEKARFLLDRRASDISQTESTVGVEVAAPVHPIFGSHQGEDAARVLETVGVRNLDLHTRANKLNNSFMHVINFDITLRAPVTVREIEERFRSNPLTPITYWLTNNEVFGEGRDWGDFGRILNQTVVCLPSIEVTGNGFEVLGTCFTPQDGNALLSSIAAALFFRNPLTYREEVMQHFGNLLRMFSET